MFQVTGLVQAHQDAAADVHVATVGLVPVAEGRAAVPRGAIPGAPTQHAGIATLTTLRICYLPFWIGAIPVLTPFPDVPMHIEQAPGVRGEDAYGCGLLPKHPHLALAVGGGAVV